MKAVVKTRSGPGNVELMDMPEPKVEAGSVIIKVRAAGICGTDIHILKGEYAVEPPVILGHEFSGEVVETGSEVTRFRPGDRVTVNPTAGMKGVHHEAGKPWLSGPVVSCPRVHIRGPAGRSRCGHRDLGGVRPGAVRADAEEGDPGAGAARFVRRPPGLRKVFKGRGVALTDTLPTRRPQPSRASWPQR